MREAIGFGETAELALENAKKELGLEGQDVEFEILEVGEKKKLGFFGGKPFKVRAFVQETPTAVAVAYLKQILDRLGAKDVTMEVAEEESGAVITLSGEDAGIVIGHHGETLDALQYLVGLVANHVREDYYRITIDTGNYREKREKTLQGLATRLANKALATNRKYALEPMNPYERRVIHTAVQEIEGATSWSEGSDMDRHVVIGPASGAAARPGNDRRDSKRGQNSRPGRKNDRPRRQSTERKLERYQSAPKAGLRSTNNAPVRSVVQASEMDEVLFSAAERGATMPTITDVPQATHTEPEMIDAVDFAMDQAFSAPAAPAEKSGESKKIPLYGRIDIKK